VLEQAQEHAMRAGVEAEDRACWLDSGSKMDEEFLPPRAPPRRAGGAVRSRGPGEGPDLLRSGQQLRYGG
jgi:hypothetical protein